MRANEFVTEKWSEKYKRSIDCSHPKGFSQRAHCQGLKKNEDVTQYQVVCDGTKKGIFTDLDKAIANAKSMFKHEKEYYHIAVVDLSTGKEAWSWSAPERDAEKNLDEHIVKHGSGYRLVSKKTGKNLGDFPSRAAAEKHEREVEYFKHRGEELNEFAVDKPSDDGRSRLIGSIMQLLKAQKKVDFFVPGIRGHVVGTGGNGDWLTLKRWNKPHSKINYSLALDAGDDDRFALKMIKPDYYQVVEKNTLDEEQLDELTFKGSPCTKDCSGHRAGYEWSQRKGGVDAASWSKSFNNGAALFKNGM